MAWEGDRQVHKKQTDIATTRPTRPLQVWGGDDSWSSYRPSSIRVSVQDLPSPSCRVLSHGHVLTIASRRHNMSTMSNMSNMSTISNMSTHGHFTMSTPGTFLLHRAADGLHESQVRLWSCPHSPGLSCVCGLVVREAGQLATIDMCRGGLPRVTLQKTSGM